MKKFLKFLVFLIILGGLGYGGYYYYKEKTKEIPLLEQYKTELVSTGDVSVKVIGTGNIAANKSVEVFMDYTETVSKVHVKEGEAIKAGDIMVEFDIASDKAELERRLQEAEINLKNAELNLLTIIQPAGANEVLQYESDIKTADKNIYDAENDIRSVEIKIAQQQLKADENLRTMEKNKALYDGGVLTRNEYELSETAYKNAVEALNDLLLQKELKENTLETRYQQKEDAEQKLANLLDKVNDEVNIVKYQQQENVIELTKLKIEQIKEDINKLRPVLYSPVSGSVARVMVSEGSVASKGAAVVELYDLSQIIVKSDITEYDAPMIELGQEVEITTSGLPDRVYTGRVTKIAKTAVEKEKSGGNEVVVPVEITIENIDDKLKVSYTVDIAVFIDRRIGVTAVPVQAILNDPDGNKYVYLIMNDELLKTEITTGLYGDKNVEIVDGINEGDIFVIEAGSVGQVKSSAVFFGI